MKYLKKYSNFSINEAKEVESIFIKNEGMSKDEEIVFLNDITTYIKSLDNISDILDNKIKIKQGDKIKVDNRGKNLLFKYKHDNNEKMKVFIKTELFKNNKKDEVIKLLVSKGATPDAPNVDKPNTDKPNTDNVDKPKEDNNLVKPVAVDFTEFNKKWTSLVNSIKTDGVKIGVPVLKVADMQSLLATKKSYVEFIQEFLNSNNKSSLNVDGKFGNKTSEEVKKFQSINKLTPEDGIVGPKTLEKIMEIIGSPITGLKVTGLKVTGGTVPKAGQPLDVKLVATLFEKNITKIFEQQVTIKDVTAKVISNNGKQAELEFTCLGKTAKDVFAIDAKGIVKDKAKMDKIKLALGITPVEKVVVGAGDVGVIDTTGNTVPLKSFQEAVNKWWESKETIVTLIINNAKNNKGIVELNKEYYKKTKRNLFKFVFETEFTSFWKGLGIGAAGGAVTGGVAGAVFGGVSGSIVPIAGNAIGAVAGGVVGTIGGAILGIAAADINDDSIKLELLGILTDNFISPSMDSQVIHFSLITDKDEDILKMIINKRKSKDEAYKLKIASEYARIYSVVLLDDLVDNDVDKPLIQAIIPKYY